MEHNSNVTVTALDLAEERACAGYLTARSAMVALARRAASLAQLVTEQPHRSDYRTVWTAVVTAHQEAVTRTALAYRLWQEAQQRTDGTSLPPLTPPFAGAATCPGDEVAA
jgi:hypothetical protein